MAEIASFVIESSNDWREDSGTLLFLAPSATTGTLIATGRMGRIVAAVALWTLETGQFNALNSSVQFVSCIARHVVDVSNRSPNIDSNTSVDDSSWVCDDNYKHGHQLNDTTHDFLPECASSSFDDIEHAICHVTIHLMVTARAFPSWAEGSLFYLDSEISTMISSKVTICNRC
jgi:hypothetical protein